MNKAFIKYLLSLCIFLCSGSSILLALPVQDAQLPTSVVALPENAIHTNAEDKGHDEFTVVMPASSDTESLIIKLKNLVFEFGEEEDADFLKKVVVKGNSLMAICYAPSLLVLSCSLIQSFPSGKLAYNLQSNKSYILFEVFRL